jgi:hypothetical protein
MASAPTRSAVTGASGVPSGSGLVSGLLGHQQPMKTACRVLSGGFTVRHW